MISTNIDNFTDSPRRLDRIAALLYNQPWAMAEEKFSIVCAAFEAALTEMAAVRVPNTPKSADSGPMMVRNSAVIGIDGVIAKKMNMFSDISGGTSTQLLDQQFDEALASSANSVVLKIDSPGGTVSGVPEFASKVFQAAQNSDKVIVAFADGMAASAAFWIASQANEFHITEASTIGSVGVVAQLFDDTRKLKNAGIEPITVRSSELKAPQTPPITAKGLASIEQSVATMFEMFKAAVERGRPGSDPGKDAGATFIGQEAVSRGFADSVTTFDKLIDKLQ